MIRRPMLALGAATLAAALTTAVGAQVAMTDVTEAAGLDGPNYSDPTLHGLGLNWVDYDVDGWPDLFTVGGEPGAPLRLYRNLGDGTFEDVAHLLPELPATDTSGSVFADYDRDGDPDIYVYTDNPVWEPGNPPNPGDGPPNLLLKNLWSESGGAVPEGGRLFVEVAAAAGVDDLADVPFGDLPGHRAKTAGWVDYDRDGCVDLFVGHWVLVESGSPANVDRLYRNRCDGTFEDVTAVSGVNPGTTPTTFRAALAFLAAHLDGDLWPDLYVVNTGSNSQDQPYINDLFYWNNGVAAEEGSGVTFTEVSSVLLGICDDAQAGMGIDTADVDNDGDWDIYIADLFDNPNDAEPPGNVLYLGNGDGTFSDNSAVAAGVQGHNSWGVNFFDVDHDGWEDLYVAAMLGATGENAEMLFINDRDGTFTNVAVDIGMETGNSRGSAVADYDGDGDLDLAVVNRIGPLQLFRNDTVPQGGWLQVKLEGEQSSRDGIGALVELSAGGLQLMRQVKGGSSAHSQDSLVVHFGLGEATAVDALTVRWPSGVVDLRTDLAINAALTVIEGQVFADGFESGDLGAWSSAVPLAAHLRPTLP